MANRMIGSKLDSLIEMRKGEEGKKRTMVLDAKRMMNAAKI